MKKTKRKLLSNADLGTSMPPPQKKEQPTKRSLPRRNARAKASTSRDSTVVIDDDVTEKEERELQAALDASLKMAGIKDASDIPDKPEKKVEIDPYEHIDKTIELFRYPFIHGIEKEIAVKMEDYLCLGKAEYLSDVIIDFYLSYIFNEKFTPEMREKVYVFPSSFYSIYSTSSDYPGWNSEENANKTALQKRYERVEGMLDLSVNYFDKEFLVFPLFQNSHWFLCIVCYPRLTQNLLFHDNTPTDDETKRNMRHLNDPAFHLVPLKSSCILTFDSVKSNAARRSTAMKHIRGFLTSHYERHFKGQFEMGKLTSCSIPCPNQPNNVDCGCFIIEFFERFFVTDPFTDFRLPLYKKEWFDPEIVRFGKRREITQVLKDKMFLYCEAHNIPNIELPELTFVSEKLKKSSIVEEENGNNSNNNCDEDMNGNGNNNNDEEFNNNNDFNCLDSNQVAVSSGENEQTQEVAESPEIVSDREPTAEEMFDALRAKDLERKSHLNIHNEDEDYKTITECQTETIPDNKADEKCDADVDMEELRSKESTENIKTPVEEVDQGTNDIGYQETHDIEMTDTSKPMVDSTQIAEKSPEKDSEMEHEEVTASNEKEKRIIEYEVTVEETEVIVITSPENNPSGPSEIENEAKSVDRPTETIVSDESTAVPFENQNAQDNSACVKECSPDNGEAIKAKKIEDTCDSSILLSD